jgi:hypothetical protein
VTTTLAIFPQRRAASGDIAEKKGHPCSYLHGFESKPTYFLITSSAKKAVESR